MRARWAASAGAAVGLASVLAGMPGQAQQNDFLGGMKNFFSGMTPNGSMHQAYEAERKDEYTALMSQRDRLCGPQTYNAQLSGARSGVTALAAPGAGVLASGANSRT